MVSRKQLKASSKTNVNTEGLSDSIQFAHKESQICILELLTIDFKI